MLKVVIIQGPPAAGKTTLVHSLANDLKIGYVAKDNIKELLYDTLGAPVTRDMSRAYGQAAIEAQFAVIRNLASFDTTILFESALYPDMAGHDLRVLMKESGVLVMQVYCYAKPEVLLSRFDERIRLGKRHSSHPDVVGERTLKDAQTWLEAYGQLPIQETVTIDTGSNDETGYSHVLTAIRRFIQEN